MIAPPAPTLAAKSDPTLGVEILFPVLSVDVDTITVLRTADGVTEAVAGALSATASGDFVVTDWQVPFGVVVTYVGQVFDGSGSSLLSAQATITVNSTDVWFQNSIDPSQSFTIDLSAPDAWQVSRTTNNQQVFVAGVPRPFNQFWGQGALTQLPLSAMTLNGADTANMDSVTSWPQLLVRTPPTFETLPRLLYAAIGSATHQYPVNVKADALITWALIVDEVQPFSKAILRPLVTWDDWRAAFPGDLGVWSGTAELSTSSTPAIITPGFTNLVTNPSGEAATTGWVAVPGTTGVAAVTSAAPATTTAYGAKVIKTAWSTASTAAGGGVRFDVPVTAGAVYSAIFNHVKASIGNRIQFSIEWRTSSATISTVTGSATVVTAGTINTGFLLENQTAPALATIARVSVLSVAGASFANWSIGSYLEVDGFLMVAGTTVSLPIPPRTITYFDGDSPMGYLWNDVIAVYGAGTWTDAIRNPS